MSSYFRIIIFLIFVQFGFAQEEFNEQILLYNEAENELGLSNSKSLKITEFLSANSRDIQIKVKSSILSSYNMLFVGDVDKSLNYATDARKLIDENDLTSLKILSDHNFQIIAEYLGGEFNKNVEELSLNELFVRAYLNLNLDKSSIPKKIPSSFKKDFVESYVLFRKRENVGVEGFHKLLSDPILNEADLLNRVKYYLAVDDFKSKKYQKSISTLDELNQSNSKFLLEDSKLKLRNFVELNNEKAYKLNSKVYDSLSIVQENKVEISNKRLITSLLEENETNQENELTNYRIKLIGFFIALLLLIGFIVTINRKIKNKLLKNLQLSKNKTYTIAEKTEQEILSKLDKFETTNAFTKSTISLKNLAKDLDTNEKYLSYIINRHKKKSFNVYINELRINYVVDLLENNPKYRNYKIAYLAKISGFVSQSNFATVFKTVKSISPTQFLKDLNQKSDES